MPCNQHIYANVLAHNYGAKPSRSEVTKGNKISHAISKCNVNVPEPLSTNTPTCSPCCHYNCLQFKLPEKCWHNPPAVRCRSSSAFSVFQSSLSHTHTNTNTHNTHLHMHSQPHKYTYILTHMHRPTHAHTYMPTQTAAGASATFYVDVDGGLLPWTLLQADVAAHVDGLCPRDVQSGHPMSPVFAPHLSPVLPLPLRQMFTLAAQGDGCIEWNDKMGASWGDGGLCVCCNIIGVCYEKISENRSFTV